MRVSFRGGVEVMSVLADSTALLPVKKIVSVIWKTPHRQNRKSCMLDYLDQTPPKQDRSWFLVILTLTVIYFVYHTSAMGFYSNHVQDIEVVRAVGPTRTCGLGCNLEEITNKTKINITDIPIIYDNETDNETSTLKLCEIRIEGRGKLSVNKNVNNSGQNLDVRIGGYYRPSDCKSRHKIAIIVPYRNRPQNLIIFMNNIHPFLINQKLEYRIFLIEQSGTQKFNKGRLFNAGFEQVQRFGNWSCLVFHDVDLLPLDERILYTCPTHPRHMSTTVVEFQQIRDYNSHFGGVTAMTAEHFRKVNGYSNMFWGWGGEDFDMFWRIRLVGLPVQRYDREIAQYTMLSHKAEPKNPRRNSLVVEGFRHSRYKKDGLSTVVYRVVSVRLRALYTHLVVDVNPNKDPTE